ncbi:MAG TPA: hypothetical protein VF007_10030 [Stellaceae bacterium]
MSQLAEPDPTMPTLDTRTGRGARACVVISATVQDGSTVVNLPDRSTLAFLGSTSLDQITFLGWDSARPIWRVIPSPRR